MRPTTEDIQAAPDHLLFPASAVRGQRKLTAKQRKFAREVAAGATKADAYRAAYPDATSNYSITRHPYIMARDERIQKEIESIRAAMEAEHIKNPVALRALVIQSLVTMGTDPNVKDATRLQALSMLGKVAGVDAFVERKEVRTISSSEDARARVLEQLRSIVKAGAQDVQAIEADADSLLAELHPPATPHVEEEESRTNTHTIPLEQSPSSSGSEETSSIDDPTVHTQEHPPS